jgi:hypothetical protein
VRRLASVLTAALGAIAAIVPAAALAQSSDSSSGGPFAAFAFCCWGVAMLLGIALLVLWVWMLIDLIQRPETDFAGGMTKTTWLVLMLVLWVFSLGWVASIVYYFMIYRKLGAAGKRAGTLPPPSQPMAPPPMAPPAPPMAPPAPPMAPPAPPMAAPSAPPMAPPPESPMAPPESPMAPPEPPLEPPA